MTPRSDNRTRSDMLDSEKKSELQKEETEPTTPTATLPSLNGKHQQQRKQQAKLNGTSVSQTNATNNQNNNNHYVDSNLTQQQQQQQQVVDDINSKQQQQQTVIDLNQSEATEKEIKLTQSNGTILEAGSVFEKTATQTLDNHHHHHHQQQQQHSAFLYTDKRPAPKRLGYFQSLLLRKWPCLALSICIMSSLIFGMLLSALTIYLLHDVTSCSASGHAIALAALTNESPPFGSHHHAHLHQADSLGPINLLPHELALASQPDELNSPVAGAGGSGDPIDVASRHLSGVAQELALNGSLMGEQQAKTSSFQRLPKTITPEHYNLFIWPHLAGPNAFQFTGSVEIQLNCLETTNNITLHTHELELNNRTIELMEHATNSSMKKVQIMRVSQDKQMQYSIIHLSEPLNANAKYLLKIDFSGLLNDDLAGFYKIKYERQNSTEPTWIAATQFQATDARRAFPCFDEPHHKATFSIKIKHWNNMTALSNMPIESSEKSSDGLWITDTFAKSHRMSTYLVAWTVTNFESRSEGNISVWTRPGFVHTAEYALKIASKILRHYEQFFGIEYPLPKMDMIALPDFNAGAMENWGLITYRETAMLYDEQSSSVANKQRVAVVVAHELAHQWFGNLVTPKWWDDLWLNEGFASFVEYIGVDHVEPEWRMLDQFVGEEVQNVFKMDSLSSSHQISIPVNNPDEISEIFDHISYAKGASVIRMMNHFLTENVFKLGLQRYLRALKYSNAEQSDLWAHLTDAQRSLQVNGSQMTSEPINVERVMNSWTLQTGYPLVNVTRNYDASEAPLAHIDQARYEPNKLMLKNPNVTFSKQKWEIPITYTWQSEQQWSPMTRLWLHQDDTNAYALTKQQASGLKPDEWFIANIQQVGYYRVNYDQRNWKMLIDQLQRDHKKISVTNRAQLLDDMFELARSGLVDYGMALASTKYLRDERDYLPWDTVLMSFSNIDQMLQRTPIYGMWLEFFSSRVNPFYARYMDSEWTMENKTTRSDNQTSVVASLLKPQQGKQQQQQVIGSNDVLEQYNQGSAISWACELGNQHCIKKARAVFDDYVSTGKNNIKPALRYATYCTVIQTGSKDDWDFLWRVYEREQSANERDRILRALGCSKEMWILARYLEWTFDKNKPIRRQDGSFVFRVIANNNYGRDLAFSFMRENWTTIKEYYGKTSFSMGHLIKSVGTAMNTKVDLEQLRAFYDSVKSDLGTGKRSFQIAMEAVEENIHWVSNNYKKIENWLLDWQKSLTKVA